MSGFGGFGPAQGIIATAVVDNGTPVAGGTTNGVLYVNSSGNLDSGSVLSFNGTNLSMASGQILAANGTASAPSISFVNLTTYGFYTDGSRLVWTANGTARGVLGGSVSVASGGAFEFSSTSSPSGTADVSIVRDSAGILAQRNGTNAQVFRVYNTFTSASVEEHLDIGWGVVSSNVLTIRTMHTGGSARTLQINHGASSSVAIQVGTTQSGGVSIDPSGGSTVRTNGAFRNGASYTGTSGEFTFILCDSSYSDGGTNSTTTSHGFRWAPTINYTGATRTGRVVGAYFNPTNTSTPTGLNAACVFSSTASTLGGMHFHNQTDEATNYEIARTYFTGNVFTIESTAAGSGTVRNINISVANAAASAVVTEVGTSTITGGVTDGYTSGLRQTPTYTAATAQTVTRHNYLDLNNPTLSGAGPAALTDACVVRFNAAAGTHKAVDSGTTKTTPGTVDAWVKVNINGTIYYMPCYTSKTA